MGERKGVNKYYPPDYDPNKGGLNKFLGTHALRERARKLHLGILIIRFEMPYNIWCEGCENHIGTGVRYNAEKKKVGMYYTTPVYQFRMKCHLCDNHFEIRTDPANLDYEIISGARRQERRWDPSENDQVAPEDKAVGRKMAADAMFKLEHSAADKTKAGALDAVMKDLEDFQESRWADDFSANQALRQKFRASENAIKAQQQVDARYNLDVPLLPPSADDSRQASLLAITRKETAEASMSERRQVLDAASVFARLKPKRVSATAKKDIAMQSIQNIVAAGTHSFDTFRNDFAKDLNVSGVVIKKKRVAPGASAVVPGSVSERNRLGKRQKASGIVVKKRKVLPVAATSTHASVSSCCVNGGASVSSNLDNSYCDTVSDSSGSSSSRAADVERCRDQKDNFDLLDDTSCIEDNNNSQHKTNSLNPCSVTIDKSVYRDVSNQGTYQMTKLNGKIEVNDNEDYKLDFEHQRDLCSDGANDVTLRTQACCCNSHPLNKIDCNVSEKRPSTSEDDSSSSCGIKQPNSLEKSKTYSGSCTRSSVENFSKPAEASSDAPACPPLSSLPQPDISTLLVDTTVSCSEQNSHPATKFVSIARDPEQYSNHHSVNTYVENHVTPSSGDDINLRDTASVDESRSSVKSWAPSTALLNLVDYSGSDSDT